jgi:hypothetical protein
VDKYISLKKIGAIATLFLGSCAWNYRDLNDTEQFFKTHQTRYEQIARLISDAGCAPPVEQLETQSQDLSNAEYSLGIEVSNEIGCVIEFTPVDFYYVIVYAQSEDLAKTSFAFEDEGSIKRRLNQNWYIIQRGWM